MKKNPTRSLTFESSILQEIAAEETAEAEIEEGIVRPPLSNAPSLLMSPGKSTPANLSEIPDPSPSSAAGEPGVKSPVASPPESKEPTVSSDESKGSRISRRSQRSNASSRMLRSNDFERTGTQQTLDSQVDHTSETLRARLGVRGGMVSGKVLHDAAVALGLTRFSEQDVNTLVNRLAAPCWKSSNERRKVMKVKLDQFPLKLFHCVSLYRSLPHALFSSFFLPLPCQRGFRKLL